MDYLPGELVVVIFSCLDLQTLLVVQLVCKTFLALTLDKHYAKGVTETRFRKSRPTWKQVALEILAADHAISIAICGPAKSGKSTLISLLMTGKWSTVYKRSTLNTKLFMKYHRKKKFLLEITEYPGGLQSETNHHVVVYCLGNETWKPATQLPVICLYNSKLVDTHDDVEYATEALTYSAERRRSSADVMDSLMRTCM